MRIDLNGAPITTGAETLQALLEERRVDASCVATALDGVFVPRARRADACLAEGTRVEILAPMQGG